MTPSVLCLVLWHWSQDGALHQSHVNILHKSEAEMLIAIVKSFTFEGHTIAIFIDGQDAGM